MVVLVRAFFRNNQYPFNRGLPRAYITGAPTGTAGVFSKVWLDPSRHPQQSLAR